MELTCNTCGALLVACAFCEREDCREALCARDVRLVLRESVPVLHEHGG